MKGAIMMLLVFVGATQALADETFSIEKVGAGCIVVVSNIVRNSPETDATTHTELVGKGYATEAAAQAAMKNIPACQAAQ